MPGTGKSAAFSYEPLLASEARDPQRLPAVLADISLSAVRGSRPLSKWHLLLPCGVPLAAGASDDRVVAEGWRSKPFRLTVTAVVVILNNLASPT